ncbi:MAG: hypothetical protein H8D22_09235 [Candidatus Cloacimonetes bacterium]|nr:hypothetical protein [Candidatus Cloacimonadota bacterium]
MNRTVKLRVKVLNEKLNKKVDVVVFTHSDEDHVKGFSEFFYLEYAAKYQSVERTKISELWVPAAIILETGLDNDDARILREEARHRFSRGKDIKVFSNPDKLGKLVNNNNKHCIVNAPTFDT